MAGIEALFRLNELDRFGQLAEEGLGVWIGAVVIEDRNAAARGVAGNRRQAVAQKGSPVERENVDREIFHRVILVGGCAAADKIIVAKSKLAKAAVLASAEGYCDD